MVRLYPAPEHRSFALGSSSRRALLVHGFPGTPWEMRGVAERLAGWGWQVASPLLPGFGPDVARLGEVRREEWEGTLQGAHSELSQGAERLVVVGYSMGAALAVGLAARARVDELVLINPFAGVPLPARAALRLAVPLVRHYRPFLRADFEDAWTRQVINRVVPDLDPGDAYWAGRLRREVKIPLRTLEQVARVGSAAWRLAPSLRTPVLLVQGRRDRLVPARRTVRFAGRLGGGAVLSLVDGEHMLVWPGQDGHDELIRELAGRFAPAGAAVSPTPARPAGRGRTR